MMLALASLYAYLFILGRGSETTGRVLPLILRVKLPSATNGRPMINFIARNSYLFATHKSWDVVSGCISVCPVTDRHRHCHWLPREWRYTVRPTVLSTSSKATMVRRVAAPSEMELFEFDWKKVTSLLRYIVWLKVTPYCDVSKESPLWNRESVRFSVHFILFNAFFWGVDCFNDFSFVLWLWCDEGRKSFSNSYSLSISLLIRVQVSVSFIAWSSTRHSTVSCESCSQPIEQQCRILQK